MPPLRRLDSLRVVQAVPLMAGFALGTKLRVWQTAYVKAAYCDPWGREQCGYVVLGRETIEVIGYMEGVEPYSNRHEEYVTLARDSADRTYRSVPCIDYCGPRTWTRCDGTHWSPPPFSTAGYVTPEGEPILGVDD